MLTPLCNAMNNEGTFLMLSDATQQIFTMYQVQRSIVALRPLLPFGDSVISKWFVNLKSGIPHSYGSIVPTLFFQNLMTSGI